MHYRPICLLIVSTVIGYDGGPTSAATLKPVDPDEHTILLLRFDEGEGPSAADSSQNHFVGQIQGARWNVGRFGHGLAFDGSGVHLDVPHDAKLCPREAVTVETWLKLRESSADVICKNNCYFMRIGGNLKAYFHVAGKWRILEGRGAVPQGRWTHVAGVWDGQEMRMYINGILRNSKPRKGKPNPNPYPVMIGNWEYPSCHGTSFGGLIDEMMIFKRALDARAIKHYYKAGKQGSQR